MQDITYISRLLNVPSSTLRNHTASGYPSPPLLASSVSTSLSYQHLLPVVAIEGSISIEYIFLLLLYSRFDVFFSKWIVLPLCSILIIEPHALTRNKIWSLYWLKQKGVISITSSSSWSTSPDLFMYAPWIISAT